MVRSIERYFQTFIVIWTETWTRTRLFPDVLYLIQRLVKTYRYVYIDTLSVVWVIFLRNFKSLLKLSWFAANLLSSFWNLTLYCVNRMAMILHRYVIFMNSLRCALRCECKVVIVWKSSWMILMILVQKRILVSICSTRYIVVRCAWNQEHLRLASKRWSDWARLRCFLLGLRCVGLPTILLQFLPQNALSL